MRARTVASAHNTYINDRMKIMRRILIYSALLLAMLTAIPASATEFDNESLHYKVMYKWGLVNKQAGRATLTLKASPDKYYTSLTARSEKWADRFFMVRDTLKGEIMRDGFKPVIYQKRSHEGGDHKHDVVRYVYNGARVTGQCTRKAWDNKGKMTRNEERTLEAYGTTVDMLSSFYYMRNLPYQNWKEGHVVTVNIYSGKRKELLTIKYLGTENVKYDKKSFRCYKIRFQFTSDGRNKTSDDMDAWISVDTQRIPVKLEGKLKVGTVRCFYTGTSE